MTQVDGVCCAAEIINTIIVITAKKSFSQITILTYFVNHFR